LIKCLPDSLRCLFPAASYEYIPPISTHVNARSKHPLYPERSPVDDSIVSWKVAAASYAPVDYVAKPVLENDSSIKPKGWADPATPNPAVVAARGSYECQKRGCPIAFEANGRPRNPVGRTGMSNRGLLGKWGPNYAADPIVTRRNAAGKLQMVAIKRRDTGAWAIPGGMVDAGEAVSATLRREFSEEAGNVRPDQRAHFEELMGHLFDDANGREVYRGYVDDPRNTDNAWIETTAMHFHCSPALAKMLRLNAGDDAADVQWLEVGDHVAQYQKLYASHKLFVDIVLTYQSKLP